MTDTIFKRIPQNYSITNMENAEERERLIIREVLCNVSSLVEELMSQEKYCEELSELIGQEDEHGNFSEIFEYWIVTPWLSEKLKAHGELVAEFLDLVIWGRQTTGQLIYADDVIGDITRELFAS